MLPSLPARAAVLLLVGALLLIAPPAPGHLLTSATAQNLDGARERVAGIEGELAEVTASYERTWAEVELAREELERLESRAGELEAEAARTEQQLADRARTVFIHGSTSQLELLLAAGGPEAALERAALASLVQDRDTAGLEEAVATRTALDQATMMVEEQRERLEALTEQLAADQADLESELEQAEGEVAALEVIAARQRTIDRGSQQGTYACPLDRHLTHFVDSWGFPRSGGRRHQGTDIMGPMGAPVYAFTDGVIARHSNSRLGGISLYLRGDDGNTYFYTHLQGYAAGGAVGNRVSAGEHIAYNGDTGNARGGAPHIHFERHPGGGSAVNPYPWLAAACF